LPIKVHFDGKIFEKQSHGGISRVFLSLFNELGSYSELELLLHLSATATPPHVPENFKIHLSPEIQKIRPYRLFGRFNAYQENRAITQQYSTDGGGIFHSTCYSVSPNPQLKQVFTLHDMIFEDYPEYFPDADARNRHIAEKKECIDQAAIIICDSNYTMKRLAENYPAVFDRKPVQVIHLASFKPPKNPSEIAIPASFLGEFSPYILHVGSRYGHKNFKRLVMAMQHIELSDLLLISIGGGAMMADEKQVIAEAGLEGRVMIIPQTSDEELIAAYKNAAVVAVPSITEGFGLPLLEALQFGCSVACSTGGSLPEVGGDAPIYFNPFDTEEMAKAIQEAVFSKNSTEQSIKAKKRASEFSWEKCANEYVDVYRSLGN